MSAAQPLPLSVFESFAADEVILDPAERALYSSDVYSQGTTAAVVLRPRDRATCASMVAAATAGGYSLIARGGGLTYTGGYLPIDAHTAIIDTAALDRILEINAEDQYITVEAGVTWKQIHQALAPLGLRLPFFGTFSGARATVGGGLSNGALFLGTARYGTGADIVLGLEVALADGSVVHTGQRAFRHCEKPFYRTCGPDLSGLFLHESGSLGVKLAATLRLMRTPAFTGHVSFVFDGMSAAGAALSEVARTAAAEDAYVFDAVSTRASLRSTGLLNDAGMLLKVVRNERGLLRRLQAGARLLSAGRNFLPADVFSLHATCAARSAAALEADLEACRAACRAAGGREIPASIPRAIRADLFPYPDGVIGAEGERWAALNAKVAHSDAEKIMAASAAALAPYEARMREHGVWMTHLLIAIGSHAFSFEPVFRWHDAWLPLHEQVLSAGAKAKFAARAVANPAARELVAQMRQRLVDLFAELGAASNQLGKTYPYRQVLRPETARFVTALKRAADPAGRMNPGALGFD